MTTVLRPGLALLALQALNKSSFLAADVGPGAAVHEQVKVVTGPARVLACGLRLGLRVAQVRC